MAKYPFLPHQIELGKTPEGTWYTRLSGSNVDLSLPPVVNVHGWPMDLGPDVILQDQHQLVKSDMGSAIFAVLATGRVVYSPYTGGCWGTNTSYPNLGGKGIASMTHMMTRAALDGHTSPVCDIWGTSMGGLTALNWAWRNPTKWHRMFMASGAVDLAFSYTLDDEIWAINPTFPSISASMRGVHGGTNEASWLPLSQPYDPCRNLVAIEPIADRFTYFGARDDDLIGWNRVVNFCADVGARPPVASAPEGQSGGQHWYNMKMSGWNDLMPLRTFMEN